jgi:ketosteroid isomerase-like protein
MSQENVEAVREMISALNQRDVDRYLARCAEDVQLHAPWEAVEGVYQGADAIRRYFSDLDDTAAPDLRLTIEQLRPIGADRVLALLRARWTTRASGMPADVLPTATAGAVPTATIYDVADAKISCIRIFLDRDEALDAAGLRE